MTYYTMIILHALTGQILSIESAELMTFDQCRFERRQVIEDWRVNGTRVHVICYPTDRLRELQPHARERKMSHYDCANCGASMGINYGHCPRCNPRHIQGANQTQPPQQKDAAVVRRGKRPETTTGITHMSALDNQVGGNHYKGMAVQPLENTYLTLGYEALRGACYCKTDKYLRRMKGDFAKHVEDISKAIHVLQVQLELATREMEKRNVRAADNQIPTGEGS